MPDSKKTREPRAHASHPRGGDGTTDKQATGMRDRLLKTGLIGAVALTLTWWTLIACGLWRAIEWAVA